MYGWRRCKDFRRFPASITRKCRGRFNETDTAYFISDRSPFFVTRLLLLTTPRKLVLYFIFISLYLLVAFGCAFRSRIDRPGGGPPAGRREPVVLNFPLGATDVGRGLVVELSPRDALAVDDVARLPGAAARGGLAPPPPPAAAPRQPAGRGGARGRARGAQGPVRRARGPLRHRARAAAGQRPRVGGLHQPDRPAARGPGRARRCTVGVPHRGRATAPGPQPVR